ncbi:MAG TPA: amidohydrolase, partial [Terriglobales bacterium]
MRTRALCLCLLLGSLAAGQAVVAGFPPKVAPADLVLQHGVMATLDPLQPQVEALAVRRSRIVAMGSDASMAAYIGPQTKVLDLHGAFVTPGFIEGHGHLMGTGQAQMELQLGPAPNWDAIVARVKAAVAKAKPGEWILGSGWQQTKWDRVPQPNVDGLPMPAALDAVSPNNPVILTHASGHGIFVNAAALKLAGITRTTPDPPGGSIVRDAQGNAIGMLRDTASGLVRRAYGRYEAQLSPAQRDAQRERALQLAVQNEISKGITTFVDMGEGFATVDWLKQQAAKGIPMRLYININGESPAQLDAHLAQYKTIGYADDHFTVRGIGEITSDGALGTRSAWFTQPYSDAPAITGKNVVAMSDIAAMARIAAREGFQVSVHAIGDRANHETLDLFQKIFTADPAAHTLRWRIEHAQHLLPGDIPRFAQMGVIASMQSIHACSDAPMVMTRVGAERARDGAYMWHTLIASGALVLDGTDTDVEDTNPIPNFYCGVTRANAQGNYLFPEQSPSQAKTRIEELRSYTWNNAYAIFADQDLGSLSVGKLADLDVISGNLLTLPAADILRTRVLYTIIGGKIVYTLPGAAAWRAGQLFPAMPEFNHV